MAQPQLPSDAAFGRIDDFFERYEGSEGDVDFTRINKETLGLIFAFAPPASPPRDSPQADDTYLNASLDFGARYMQANTAWVPVDQPMPPWTSAHIFTQAARAASKVHVPSEKAWTFRRFVTHFLCSPSHTVDANSKCRWIVGHTKQRIFTRTCCTAMTENPPARGKPPQFCATAPIAFVGASLLIGPHLPTRPPSLPRSYKAS